MEEIRTGRGCRWPMWPHASRPNHEYCGARKAAGSSYCEQHKTMSIRDFETEPRQPFVPNKQAA